MLGIFNPKIRILSLDLQFLASNHIPKVENSRISRIRSQDEIIKCVGAIYLFLKKKLIKIYVISFLVYIVPVVDVLG
jgi:hypothetical protein